MSETDQNEFNNALGYIQRLDKILNLLAEAKAQHSTNQYLDFLKLFFHELYTEIKEEKRIEYKKSFRRLTQELKDIRQKHLGVPETFLDDIEDIELELRLIFKSSGLQMKVKKGAGQSLN